MNYFVPMCNGRGKRIIMSMVDAFVDLSTRYGYSLTPEDWLHSEPRQPTPQRYSVRYSACMFALAFAERPYQEGITVFFDTIASMPVMQGGSCAMA